MPISLTRVSSALIDERAPMFFTEPADLAAINASTAVWLARRGMIEGVAAGSALPFRLKDALALQSFRPPRAGLALPILATDTDRQQDYLQFGYGGTLARRTLTLGALRLKAGGANHAVNDLVGYTGGVIMQVLGVTGGAITSWVITNYGNFATQPTAVLTQTSTTGSGTGAVMMPEMATNCGSLAIAPVPDVLPASNIFTVISVWRIPVVGGVAGADPGGYIYGCQVGQSEINDAGANNRWWGLKTNAAGQAVAQFTGDVVGVTGSTQPDRRDGAWHVSMQTFNPGIGAGSASLWQDGALIGTSNSFATFNSLAGARQLRIGAAGLPDSPPCGGYAGDVGMMAIVPLDLNMTANAALRQSLGTLLLQKWRGSGAWG